VTSECGLVISIIKNEVLVGHGLEKAQTKFMKIQKKLYDL